MLLNLGGACGDRPRTRLIEGVQQVTVLDGAWTGGDQSLGTQLAKHPTRGLLVRLRPRQPQQGAFSPGLGAGCPAAGIALLQIAKRSRDAVRTTEAFQRERVTLQPPT